MLPAGYAQYRTVTTQTATPGDLLLQLYQAAIRNIGQAQLAIGSQNIASAHQHIVRTQEIVTELQRTLDHDQCGDLTERLDALYSFMLQRLLLANIHKDTVPLGEVQGLLRQLLAAWQVAVREATRQAAQIADAARPATPSISARI